MATGDGINVSGSYATVQVAASTVDAAMSAGATSSVATALPAEAAYFLLDFEVIVSVGTPLADGYVSVFKKAGGGSAAAPDPTTTFQQIFVGNATLDITTGSYYLRGVPNDDPADEYFMQNQSGSTITIALAARGRTYRAQA